MDISRHSERVRAARVDAQSPVLSPWKSGAYRPRLVATHVDPFLIIMVSLFKIIKNLQMRPIIILWAVKENVKMLFGIEQYLGDAIIVRIVQLLGYFVFQPNVQSVGILSRLDFFQFL